MLLCTCSKSAEFPQNTPPTSTWGVWAAVPGLALSPPEQGGTHCLGLQAPLGRGLQPGRAQLVGAAAGQASHQGWMVSLKGIPQRKEQQEMARPQ